MATAQDLEVGTRVWRHGRDWFTNPSTPRRIGAIVAKYHPPSEYWSHTNQADWWRGTL